jgi:hypothetical protein
MAKIMICLISEQRMQNIIPLYQRGASFKEVYLVRSKDADEPNSRFATAWKNTQDVLQQKFMIQSVEPAVDAYGIAETQKTIADLLADLLKRAERDQIVVNFTGGTKCMSIGAYIAARDAGVIALYVDTANEKLVWFYPDDSVQQEEFDCSVTVDVYLRAYGKQLDEDRTRKHALPKGAYPAAQELVNLWPQCRKTLEAFGKAISKEGKNWVDTNEVDDNVAGILENSGFIQRKQNVWEVTQQGKPFLTGGWLEAMVYVLLRDSKNFDDVQIRWCIKGIENELDVLLTRNGQMAIIDCRSGDLGGQTTLNRLQALRSVFGTFARTFFVTSRDKDDVDNAFLQRAKEYGVREIVTSESLLDIAKIIREKMRGVP